MAHRHLLKKKGAKCRTYVLAGSFVLHLRHNFPCSLTLVVEWIYHRCTNVERFVVQLERKGILRFEDLNAVLNNGC